MLHSMQSVSVLAFKAKISGGGFANWPSEATPPPPSYVGIGEFKVHDVHGNCYTFTSRFGKISS